MSVCEWERERDKNENKLKQMENGREWMCEKWRNEDKKNDWYDSDETNGKEDEMNEIIWNDWIEMKRSVCIEYIYIHTHAAAAVHMEWVWKDFGWYGGSANGWRQL